MNRIMVIGVSSGVGKSTFARELGEIMQLDVYHLDQLYWKPNWVEAPAEEFKEGQRKVAAQERWIIEGNYMDTFDLRIERAEKIIYLELPLRVCLYRVCKRWITHIGKTRPDMGEGCKEKLDYSFITFILKTYHRRKRKMTERFRALKKDRPSLEIITLKNKKAIQRYIEHLNEVENA